MKSLSSSSNIFRKKVLSAVLILREFSLFLSVLCGLAFISDVGHTGALPANVTPPNGMPSNVTPPLPPPPAPPSGALPPGALAPPKLASPVPAPPPNSSATPNKVSMPGKVAMPNTTPSAGSGPKVLSLTQSSKTSSAKPGLNYEKPRPRKYRSYGREAQVEEYLRAARDPHYVDYLKQKEKEKIIEIRGLEEHSRQREAQDKKDESARLAYIQQRDGKTGKSHRFENFLVHEKEKREWWNKHETARKNFLVARTEEKKKAKAERKKNLQAYWESQKNSFDSTILSSRQASDRATLEANSSQEKNSLQGKNSAAQKSDNKKDEKRLPSSDTGNKKP